ncbi:hypothetical protein ACFPK9_02000 [Rubritalea spongiae]|uniref:Uncharacterized protein n=1 Tax=Rubritalea spongiae TaxID=430797 RepID=A0ABW5E5M8_9BACT
MEETDLVTSLIPAVQEQLNSKDTPYVKKAYDRILELEDVDEEEALKMIALCLADESNRMFIDKRDFDVERYQELLDALPELPEG